MKKKHYFLLLILILASVYMLGPTPNTPDYEGTVIRDIERVYAVESPMSIPPGIKKGSETKAIYSGSPTPYSILYLHGFSASPEEGNPTMFEVASHFGWNLYAPLLHDHGIETEEPLLNYRADSLWATAVRGLEFALSYGDSVIIMSTSTGGPLATRLAQICPRVAGMIYYSPNVMPNDGAAFLLNNPWGEQIAKVVFNSNYRDVQITDPYYEKHWYRYYRIESLPQMQEIVESGFSPEAVASLDMPVMVATWYEDENKQDNVVSVAHIREFYNDIPSSNKALYEMAAGTHVMANGHYNHSIRSVIDTTISFLEKSGFAPVAQDTATP